MSKKIAVPAETYEKIMEIVKKSPRVWRCTLITDVVEAGLFSDEASASVAVWRFIKAKEKAVEIFIHEDRDGLYYTVADSQTVVQLVKKLKRLTGCQRIFFVHSEAG